MRLIIDMSGFYEALVYAFELYSTLPGFSHRSINDAITATLNNLFEAAEEIDNFYAGTERLKEIPFVSERETVIAGFTVTKCPYLYKYPYGSFLGTH